MIIFNDGCSYYTDSFLDQVYDVRCANAGGGTIGQSLTGGRAGLNGVVGGSITFVTGNGGAGSSYPLYVQKNYDARSTIIYGIAIKQTGTQNVLGGRLLTFVDASTTQVGIDIMQSGQLRVVRSTDPGTGIVLRGIDQGGNSQQTVLGTSANVIQSSSFDFIEVKVVHHPTAGSVTIKYGNGDVLYDLTNVNTAISGANQSASMLIGGFSSVGVGAGSTTRHVQDLKAVVTDVHIINTDVNGSDPNDPTDFIGDRHWYVAAVTSDGTYAEYTPTPSANHWENVDEIPPDGITSNNSTEVVGRRDSFLCSSIIGPSSASVILSYTMYLEKNTGGPVGVSGLMRSPAGGGGADRNGTEFQVPTPFAFRRSYLCTAPGGSSPITVATANAAEHGYERTS